MEEVFENDPKPLKEKKIRKKRVVSEETKKRLRAQLAKGRATALANRKKKLAAKNAKKKPEIKSPPKVVEPIKEELVSTKEPVPKEEPKIESPRSTKKEVVVNKPPPPKIKEEPKVVDTPAPPAAVRPRISEPIPIPPPLEYQSTFRKMRRKW